MAGRCPVRVVACISKRSRRRQSTVNPTSRTREGWDMRKALLILTLLCATGLIAMPVDGAEFRVTGFFDQAIPHFGSNLSAEDEDATQKDEIFFGRMRTRFFFNFIASDDLRGIFALETDNCFGEPS